MNNYVARVLEETKKKNANEPEYLQAVEEVLRGEPSCRIELLIKNSLRILSA